MQMKYSWDRKLSLHYTVPYVLYLSHVEVQRKRVIILIKFSAKNYKNAKNHVPNTANKKFVELGC